MKINGKTNAEYKLDAYVVYKELSIYCDSAEVKDKTLFFKEKGRIIAAVRLKGDVILEPEYSIYNDLSNYKFKVSEE